MEMTGNAYQQLAARTINKSLSPHHQSMHALFGMCSELGEICKVYVSYNSAYDERHLKSEVGDFLWFIAEFCTSMQWNLDDIIEVQDVESLDFFSGEKSRNEAEFDLLHMSISLGDIQGMYQKVYQGHELRDDILKDKVATLCWYVSNFCADNGWTLDSVMIGNILKLQKRYPEGFTVEESLHRKEGDI